MDQNKQHLRIDRRYRRVATDIACEVCGVTRSERLPARILNLSVGGLKFRCGLHVINSILPADQRTPGQILDVALNVFFELPYGGDPAVPITSRVSVVHSERLSQNEFHVGVKFMNLAEEVVANIEGYINSELQL